MAAMKPFPLLLCCFVLTACSPLTTQDDCGQDVGLRNEAQVCYEDGKIVFSVVNDGSVDFAGVQVKVTSEGHRTLTDVKEALPAGASLEGAVVYEGGRADVVIVPYVVREAQKGYCITEAVIVDEVPDC